MTDDQRDGSTRSRSHGDAGRRLALAAAAALTLGACVGSTERTTNDHPAPTAADPQRLGDPYLGPMHFDWGSDCAVAVREHVTKAGTTAELTYQLRITGDPGGATVAFEDMRIDRLNGEQAEAPPAVLAGFRLPSFEIDETGRVVEVSGIQDLIDELGDVAPGLGTPSTPGFVAVLEETVASKYWGSWVGLWVDVESIDEVEHTVVVPQELNGVSYDVEVTVSSVGTDAAGDVVLRLVEVIEGENFARAFLGINGTLGSKTTTPPDFEGSRTTTVEIITDPADLRTTAAWFTQEIAVSAEGQHQARRETRAWTFDWEGSDCS